MLDTGVLKCEHFPGLGRGARVFCLSDLLGYHAMFLFGPVLFGYGSNMRDIEGLDFATSQAKIVHIGAAMRLVTKPARKISLELVVSAWSSVSVVSLGLGVMPYSNSIDVPNIESTMVIRRERELTRQCFTRV